MKRPALLDSSFLIDLERETAAGEIGPARAFLPSLRGRPLVLSVVSVEEVLEGTRPAPPWDQVLPTLKLMAQSLRVRPGAVAKP